jgi:hypothetical protein
MCSVPRVMCERWVLFAILLFLVCGCRRPGFGVAAAGTLAIHQDTRPVRHCVRKCASRLWKGKGVVNIRQHHSANHRRPDDRSTRDREMYPWLHETDTLV